MLLAEREVVQAPPQPVADRVAGLGSGWIDSLGVSYKLAFLHPRHSNHGRRVGLKDPFEYQQLGHEPQLSAIEPLGQCPGPVEVDLR